MGRKSLRINSVIKAGTGIGAEYAQGGEDSGANVTEIARTSNGKSNDADFETVCYLIQCGRQEDSIRLTSAIQKEIQRGAEAKGVAEGKNGKMNPLAKAFDPNTAAAK